jgi:hypothetical protein
MLQLLHLRPKKNKRATSDLKLHVFFLVHNDRGITEYGIQWTQNPSSIFGTVGIETVVSVPRANVAF